MKKLFSIVFLIAFTVSCSCNETLTVFTLNEQEKTIVPYKLNDTVQWVDNKNATYKGIVNDVIDRYSEDKTDCDRVKFNDLLHYIEFDNFKYLITISKSNIIRLGIHEYANDKSTKYFTGNPNDFATVEFNGETYENAILLKQSVLDDMPFGHLVFSKKNGIEFILFKDGTWYKRVE